MKEKYGLLKGKSGLIIGVENNRYIDWGIEKEESEDGEEIELKYKGEELKKSVEKMEEEIGELVEGN